ncbi:MAG: hypothetical protein WBG92_21345 [Thiohalocapsa sp.]
MQALIEGEPELRRRFVDWNLFHVEPRYSAVRATFRRTAAQRQAWLKSGGAGPAVWDDAYADVLARICDSREAFFRRLQQAFMVVASGFDLISGLVLEWRRGLPDAPDIVPWLSEHRRGDVARGYSFLSPARSDFHLSRGGERWVGSRGQNKLAGVLLQLAAGQVVASELGDRGVWLVDDLAAELDSATQRQLMPLLINSADHALLTSLQGAPPGTFEQASTAVFHVEHGKVRQQQAKPSA